MSTWAVDFLYRLYLDGDVEKFQKEFEKYSKNGSLTGEELADVTDKLVESKSTKKIAALNNITLLVIKIDCTSLDSHAPDWF